MMRALFAGVRGLRNHQARMDVIGNNIANVNTLGFKAARATFKEAFFETLRAAGRPSESLGGTNPVQIGSGSSLGSIDQIFTQGALETTGQPLDLAIQGDALFVLRGGQKMVYSRAGNFRIDGSGRIVNPATGLALQGILADEFGSFESSGVSGDLRVPLGARSPARPTSSVHLAGNLDARAAVGDTYTLGLTVYDNLGTAHSLQMVFTNTAPGQWTWTAESESAPGPTETGTITFNGDGSLQSFTYPAGASSLTLSPPGGVAFDVTFDAGEAGGLTGLCGFANPSNAVADRQDGYPAGDLTNLTFDARGVLSGTFSNGITRPIARLVLAVFNNTAGLQRVGDNVYEESPNSGSAILCFAEGGGRASITPGALEGSNVDISEEFSNMIIAQRGFQANARIVTTADEMLNEVVNLRR